MHRTVKLIAALQAIVLATPLLAADTPKDVNKNKEAELFVKRVIAKASAERTVQDGQYLKMAINEEETTAKGDRVVKRHYDAIVRFPELLPARLEMANNVILVNLGADAWAKIKGKLDDRRQTPMMLRGKQHQVFFPLLLPWSLGESGVLPISVEKVTFEKTPAIALKVRFEKSYFVSPVMTTDWTIFFEPKTLQPIAAQYTPPPKFLELMQESVRYRYLRWEDVGGFQLPSVVLAEGFHDKDDVLTGHLKTTRVKHSLVQNPDPMLFANPNILKQLDGE